ncbi:phage-like element PBSX protein XkdA [Siminovitchia terrae]|uniref:ImmA/IrrE family metallo-endopeptidase n=1 Tax=Siminovitchia terrae TaxID=1914933 RepID=UPI001B02A2A4|nr:ImmA/IrrE family metallo-endopeptidase [Siminovitchia terrae]GIN93377.1 phage-like element PBSX protein XkdA [Siminovitchia terrae]
MYYSYLEDFIKNLYQTIGINTPTELDMKSIAGCLNIELQFWDEPSEAVRDAGIPWIFINEKLSPKEQWQDFCHELCHALQHVGDQRNLPVEFRLYQEVKADNFMYNFCIPTFMLEDYEFPKYKWQAIQQIANDFNVTIEFASIRFNMYQNKKQQHLHREEWQHSQVADYQSTYSTEQDMDTEFNLDHEILPDEVYDFFDLSVNKEAKVEGIIEFIKHIREKQMR